MGPMDPEQVRRWGKSAEAALRTERHKFITNWSDFNTKRVVPEVERHVRDLLKSGNIPMTSWFCPEDKRWYRIPQPPRPAPAKLRSPAMQKAREEGYDSLEAYGLSLLADQPKREPRVFPPVPEQIEPGRNAKIVRALSGNAWDELDEVGQHHFDVHLNAALRTLISCFDISENMDVAKMKLIDSMMHGAEWTKSSIQQQAKITKGELSAAYRDSDDTEIPLREVERLERRLTGLREQHAVFHALFRQLAELRPQFASYLSFEWPEYRSREESQRDRQALRRMRRFTSHAVMAMSDKDRQKFLDEQRPYRPRFDGVDAAPEPKDVDR
jgi:hypothetical protein